MAKNLGREVNLSEEDVAIKTWKLFFLQDRAAAGPRATVDRLEGPEKAWVEDQLNMGEPIERSQQDASGQV